MNADVVYIDNETPSEIGNFV
jgi:hypothetical protein